MIVNIGDASVAQSYLDPRVEVVEYPTDDAWARDVAPTFVVSSDGQSLKAVDWVFNGWGQQPWSVWEKDALLAKKIALLSDAEVLETTMVNEGGGIHVDGEGTVLLTETVQLDGFRTPGMTKEQAEAEIHRLLGTEKAIWLPREFPQLL
jgi:agmatine deiminase